MKKKTKSFLASMMILTFSLCNMPIMVKAQTKVESGDKRVNFALNGSATANNTEAGQENTWGPDKTIDGIVNRDAKKNEQSRWSTDRGTSERVLTIDLKESKIFDEFNIEWERNNIKNFNIKVSNDNESYTEVYKKPDSNNISELTSNIKLEAPVSARYVKLSITEFDGGDLNWESVSVYEFEVIGTVTNTNLAKESTATASGSEDANVFGPSKAIDGIINKTVANAQQSRWASDVGIAPKWLQLDLKEVKQFQTLVIEWERKNATEYSIEVSDNGSDWESIKAFDNSPENYRQEIILDKAVSARYVRLKIDNFVGTGAPEGAESITWNTISVYEFEIYNGNLSSDNGSDEVDPTENIALNKSATASSKEANGLEAAGAVDGKKGKSNRWASAVRDDEEWLRVDLGKSSAIKTVVIDWERRNATSYAIQVSDDDSNWTTVKEFDTHPRYNSDKIVLDEVAQGRYIRLLIKKHATTDQVSGGVSWNNVSVEEFSVYSGILEDTAQDIANKLLVPEINNENDKLTMPTVPEGFGIEFVGADYEQVIGKDLTIYQPIVDTTVTVTFEISKGEEKAFTEGIPVKVPGKYTEKEGANDKPVVVPEIREWLGKENDFEITDTSRILIDTNYKNQLSDMAKTFAEDYKDVTGRDIEVVESSSPNKGDIYFTLSTGDEGLGKEGHLMTISDYIKVEAKETTGAYWATMSILQILKQNDTTIPQGIIRDYPKYEVRGFMLDVGRMPFSLNYLYETAKAMSWYKMNDFQVHLNDNYIFLEDYSNKGEDPMEAYSGFRLESNIKKGGNGGLNKADLTNKDTFYTKAEFNKFIKDSRAIGVNIVPEFDTPAHSLAFTKVRPDLKMGNVGRQADHLDVTNPESLKFVEGLWDEYLDGENPVFDDQTTINIGTDEYDAKYTEQFRKFTDDLLGYIQEEKGRTVRLWGSLTARPGETPIRSENVQMNIWNTGWANPNQMFKEGYDLINMVDGTLYIVPGAGYYYDYLNKSNIYNNWQPNAMGGTPIPAGHEQMLGSSYAIWNDMIDKKQNGMIEYDIYDRFIDVLPAYSSKLWGNAEDLSFDEMESKVEEIGNAPNTNMESEIDSKSDDVLNLGLDDDKDASGNEYDIKNKVNSSIEKVDGRNALKLTGNESYAETELTNIGMGSALQFKVKKSSGNDSEQILFESEEGSIKAVQKGTGNVGFSRAGRDYSFDYKLPDDEWVELAFTNVKDKTSLYVNGKLTQTIGDSETGVGKIHATFKFPLTRIGSSTKAFDGYIDDVRVIKGSVQVPTLDLVNTIAQVSDLVADDYTVESWETLQNALSKAKDIVSKLNATQEEVNDAVSNLEKAIESLDEKSEVPSINKDELKKLYDANKDKNEEDYTEESWNNFKKALEEAKAVLDNESATQEEVNDAEANLEKAIGSLKEKPEVPSVNKDQLKLLYEYNKDRNEEDYTEESWNNFKKALEEAKAVLDNEAATQEDVGNAGRKLADAIANLEVKEEKPPVDNENPEDPEKPENPGNNGDNGVKPDKPSEGEVVTRDSNNSNYLLLMLFASVAVAAVTIKLNKRKEA